MKLLPEYTVIVCVVWNPDRPGPWHMKESPLWGQSSYRK